MNWHLIGSISLYTLIGFAALMLVIMAWRKAWYWFTVFSGITGCVLLGELVSFLALKKSISNQYGMWIQSDPFWAWTALILFLAAMVSLVIHLAAYGLRGNKK